MFAERDAVWLINKLEVSIRVDCLHESLVKYSSTVVTQSLIAPSPLVEIILAAGQDSLTFMACTVIFVGYFCKLEAQSTDWMVSLPLFLRKLIFLSVLVTLSADFRCVLLFELHCIVSA